MDLRVISLGAGVQSSTLYRLAARGDLQPLPDAAIFADTQCEPPWVYQQLDELEGDHGDTIPILRATAGDLEWDLLHGRNTTGHRFASVPFWVRGEDGREAPGRRQCTREYKIDVVRNAIRELLGLKPGQRAHGRYQVEEWVGISLDEASRARPSRYPWVHTRWPLLFDKPMRRADCLRWHAEHGYDPPRKSACVFCPYRPAAEYARWRDEEPELFESACKTDDAIRESGSALRRGMRSPQYVTRLLVPLRDLPSREELERDDRNQLELFDDACEGMCGL